MKKMHVIFVITFAPKYNYQTGKGPQPLHSWKNSKGEDVSIWKEDWANIFGNKMIKKFPDITFEVLRGDYRADKIYSYKFETGLLYKSFPANTKRLFDGIKRKDYIYSDSMENYIRKLAKEKKDELVMLIPAERTAFTLFFTKIFRDSIPTVHFHFTNNKGLLKEVTLTAHPLKLIHRIAVREQRKLLNKQIRFLQVSHLEKIGTTNDFKSAIVEIIGFGVDSTFWHPVMKKEEARKILGIKAEKVLLFSSRLVEEYQIIEAMEVLSRFKDTDFVVLLTSYGSASYVSKLKKVIEDLGLDGKVQLLGYVSNEVLRTCFSAADVFMMTSKENAVPYASFKAIMMRTPIITTNSGRAAELLNEHKCGITVSTNNYEEWYKAIKYLFDGGEIPIIKNEIQEFSWDYNLNKWRNFLALAQKGEISQ